MPARDPVAYSRAYRAADPERTRAANRRWRAANPLKVRRQNQKFAVAHPGYHRDQQRRKVEQRAPRPRPAACEVCGNTPRGYKKVLCLDHNNETGEFRGWICDACNKILGYAGDDPERLEALARYVRSRALQ